MTIWTMPRRAIALAGLSFASHASGAAPAPAQTGLTLHDAVAMARVATDTAEHAGAAVSIVVVNREGRVILSQRMDGASFKSLEVAEGKAITAAALGLPTRLLEEALAKGDQSVLSVPNVIAITGGLPVSASGQTIAAVGVSGSAPKEDEAIAGAARDAYPGKP